MESEKVYNSGKTKGGAAMGLWKYPLIAIILRAMLILQDRFGEIWTWIFYGISGLIFIFFIQRDVRNWLNDRNPDVKKAREEFKMKVNKQGKYNDSETRND